MAYSKVGGIRKVAYSKVGGIRKVAYSKGGLIQSLLLCRTVSEETVSVQLNAIVALSEGGSTRGAV